MYVHIFFLSLTLEKYDKCDLGRLRTWCENHCYISSAVLMIDAIAIVYSN